MTIITRIADYVSSLFAPGYLNHADIFAMSAWLR